MRFDLSIVAALISLGITVYLAAKDEIEAAAVAAIAVIFYLIVEVD